MKKLIVTASIIMLSGCAGLSQQDKAESKALKAYQQADAKVERKVVKLGLASAASGLALKNVAVSAKELDTAKKERVKAKEALNTELDLSS